MEADDFLELVRKRRSCRGYLEKPVPDHMLEHCLEAARLAPSACNKQPWRFIIVKNAELRGQLCEKALLPGIPMPWLRQAPVIVALYAERSLVTHRLAPMISGVQYHLLDLGIAGEHFVLAAEAQGLGTCWIGWFKEKSVKRILKLDRKTNVVSLISVGFPSTNAEPSSRMERNQISRTIP